MNSPNPTAHLVASLSRSERAALLDFFEKNLENIRKHLRIAPIAFEHQSGKTIAFYTYEELLDQLSSLRSDVNHPAPA